jgi:hypothetical protein
LTINGRELEEVKSFTYLSSIIAIVGGALEDICGYSKEANGPSCSYTQFGGIKVSYS